MYFTAYSCILQNISRDSKLNGITGFTGNFNLLLRRVKTFFIIDKVNVYKDSRMFLIYVSVRFTSKTELQIYSRQLVYSKDTSIKYNWLLTLDRMYALRIRPVIKCSPYFISSQSCEKHRTRETCTYATHLRTHVSV